MNVIEEVPWCVACQSLHSSKHCLVAQFIASSQEVEKEEDPKEGNTDSTTCNMIGSCYDYETNEDCAKSNQDVVYKSLFHESCHQQIFSEDEEEIDSRACNMLSTTKNISLRKPSKEEISNIIANMISQVQSNYGSREKIVKYKPNKVVGIFIKDVAP